MSKSEKSRLESHNIGFLIPFSAKIVARISHPEDERVVAVGLVTCVKPQEIEGEENLGITTAGFQALPIFSPTRVRAPLTAPGCRGGQQSLSQSGTSSYTTGCSVSDIKPGKSFKTTSI